MNQFLCKADLSGLNVQAVIEEIVGPGLTKFRIDRMAFCQPESTCLNIQNVPHFNASPSR